MKKTVGAKAMVNEMPATLHLEGKHALALKAHKVGAKANLMVSGTKHSHYQNSDGTHSVGFRVTKVSLKSDQDDLSGPDNKASNNQRDGGKMA